MSTGGQVTEAAYLTTSYQPDCEYVGGVLVERSVGDYLHSLVQGLIIVYFDRLRARYGPLLRPFPGQRMRTWLGEGDQGRYRVPDVLVLAAGHKRTPVLVEAPLMAIEILSPKDDLARTVAKCAEYVELGTLHVWIFDPYLRLVYVVTQDGYYEAVGRNISFVVNGVGYEFAFAELFAEMDQD